MTPTDPTAIEQGEALFRRHGGTLRMSEALRLGLSRWTLYAMRDAGVVERVSRGLYRLADLPPLSTPDLVTVALRVSNGVICLISALAYHELTTEIPHEVHVAIERGREQRPQIRHPPVRYYRFSGKAFSEGIETHEIDGVPVRIYSPEKTIADCFKYRNKLGMDVPLEALRMWRRRKGIRVEKMLEQARHCRVENVMRPYLESVL